MRAVLLFALVAFLFAAGLGVLYSRPPLPPGTVLVDGVPPDACVAFYGPGPCREHGMKITGSTDAIAGPPPKGWHGKVR